MRRRKTLFCAAAVMAAATAWPQMRDIYVAPTGPAGGAATSWTNAYTNISFAIQAVGSNAYIYVKGGTYVCTNITVTNKNIFILGGYEGTNTVDLPGPYDTNRWPTYFQNPGAPTNRLWWMSRAATVTVGRINFVGGFTNNQAGGAMQIENCTNIAFFDCNFTDNRARWGGAILATNTLNLTFSNCCFARNTATNMGAGGAFYGVISSNVLFRDCVFDGNTAPDGGAVFVTNMSVALTNVSFANNSATNRGGGLFLCNNATAAVSRCSFIFNIANAGGGGLWLTNGLADIRGSIFAYNNWGVNTNGQSLYNAFGKVYVSGSTFGKHDFESVNNAAGVFGATNSIFWEDTTNDLVGVAASSIAYCNTRSGLNNGTNGCTSVDPLFASDFDFHLQSQQGRWDGTGWVEDPQHSPCIDAGDPTSDFSLEPEPNGGRVNMGAYGNTPQASKSRRPPTLVVDPLELTVRVMRGQAASNNFFMVKSTNSLNRMMVFTNTSLDAWLSVAPAGGAISNDVDFLTMTNTYDTAGMAVGVYTGRVVVSATDAYTNTCYNSPQTNVTRLVVGDEPRLAVSTNRLSRIVNEGYDASPQLFDVWNETSDYGLQYVITTNVPWLSVSPTGGVSYGELDTVRLDYHTAALGAGTHTGRLTVAASVAEYPAVPVTNSPKYIDVTVTVLAKPGLKVSPGALTNHVTVGYTANLQTFEVWNESPPPRCSMLYSIATNASWMKVSPVSGSSTGDHDVITVWYSTAFMPVGLYTGLITVASTGASNTPQIVRVYMNVTPAPELAVSATTLTNSVLRGFNAPSQSFNIWNGCDAPKGRMNYTIVCDTPWLALSAYSGSVVDNVDTITLTYNTAGLAGGGYEGEIAISAVDPYSGVTAGTRYIRVVLEVVDLPLLSVRPSATLITNSIYEGLSGAAVPLDVWNGSGIPVALMDFMCVPDQTWLSVSPSSGSTRETPVRSYLSFDASALSPGTYSATLSFYGWEHVNGIQADGSPRQIEVRLTVLPRTPLSLEDPHLSGKPHIGRTLSLFQGLWDRPASMTLTQKWQRADTADGFNLADIAGATSTNYVVARADAGKYIRAVVTATDSTVAPPRSTSKATAFVNAFKIKALPGDYDSDGVSDTWFYFMPWGEWHFRYSADGSTAAKEFGWFEAVGVPGDYDGDGYMDIAVYYQAAGIWYILTYSGAFYIQNFGWYEAMAVPADYDGDGATDMAVYHPATGMWYIMSLSGRVLAWALPFGWAAATPAPADYNGDGAADIAVYHQAAGRWYAMTLGCEVLIWGLHFGWADAMPAPADYDGTGAANVAVYYQAGNTWYILHSNGVMGSYSFGTSAGAGIPIPYDYDGDGRWDMATIHQNGDFVVWCIQRSRAGYAGHAYQFSTGTWR